MALAAVRGKQTLENDASQFPGLCRDNRSARQGGIAGEQEMIDRSHNLSVDAMSCDRRQCHQGFGIFSGDFSDDVACRFYSGDQSRALPCLNLAKRHVAIKRRHFEG